MKKLFLFFFASLLSISMFAAGETGKTKGQAIPYNWTSGIHVASDAGVGKWYVVNLLKDDGGPFNANGKTDDGKTDISISVVNPLSEEATVDVVAYIGDNETSRHFTLAAGGSKAMTFGAGMFVRMGINEVYLYLVMDVTVTEEQAAASEAVNVNVQTVESNAVSFVPVDYNWTSGNTIAANTETWLKIDMNGKVGNNQTFEITVTNNGGEATTIYGGLAIDCPATNIQEQSREITAHGNVIKTLDRAMLDMIPDIIYLRLKAGQEIHVWAHAVDIPTDLPTLFNADDAVKIVKGMTYSIAGNSVVYKVGYEDLVPNDYGENTKYYAVQVEITNEGTTPVTLTGKVAKNAEGEVKSAVTRTYTLEAGQTISKKLDKTLIGSLQAEDSVFALVLDGNSNVKFLLKDTCLEDNPCVPEQVIAMTIPAAGSFVEKNQAAGTTKWYAVNIEAAKSAQADIELTMTASETANLDVDIAIACALGEPTQSYTGTTASTTKTLSYSLIKGIEGNVVYVRVKTNKAITVKAEILSQVRYTSTGWSPNEPSIETTARVEAELKIGETEPKTIKALGLTLAEGGLIHIYNGGKLIVGKEGIKGSELVSQIIIEDGGVLLIDPAATTNNKPFVTAKKKLWLGAQEAGARTSELHEFIAIPIDNREASVDQQLHYAHWDRLNAWVANDGFRTSFVGYNVFAKSTDEAYPATDPDYVTINLKGQLAVNKDVTLNMPAEGWYGFGNSWTAPIKLNTIYGSQLSGSGDEAAIHFFVPKKQTYGSLGEILDNSYIPATEDIASNLGITEIAPMQGFFLYTASSNSVALNYSNVYASQLTPASPAPKRAGAVDNRNKVAVVLNDGNASDFVYMIEGEATNAHKMMSEGFALYAEDGLAQVATDNLIGTILTVKTNDATEYTIRFTWVNGETMYLKDLVNGNIIAMTEENQYTFIAEPNTVNERFQVIGRNDAPTGMESNAAIEGANKRIENGKVVIIKNGVKYDVLGAQL